MGKKEDAFTLLELIIALTIGAALIVLVSVSVRMGFFQMGRGSKALEESLREKNAVHFFCQQVSSLRRESVGDEVIFNGDSKNILFVTPMSLEKNYSTGLMTATFFLEKGETGVKLNYKEKRHIPVEDIEAYKGENRTIFDQSESVTIFEGFDEIVFQFLDSEDSEDEGAALGQTDAVWKDSWLEKELPKAIKLIMTKNGIKREVVAPIMVMY
ncbi:MAG: prepilin-type N-terminal cleavage/methylation domain-containing protein [Candidatus Scalindua sp.]|nr:prepilin-type N-terminal cleavage/methylation domain-containing protein [Candidatus Scalindua sp.]